MKKRYVSPFLVLQYVKPYWPYMVGAFACSLVVAVVWLFIPGYLQDIGDKVLPKKDIGLLNTYILIGLGMLLVHIGCTYGKVYLSAFFGQRAVTDLRYKLFSHLQRMPFSFYTRWRTGEIISRSVNDIKVIEDTIVGHLINVPFFFIVLIGLLVKVFTLNWQLALITCITLPLVGVAMGRLGERIKRVTSLLLAKTADISSLIQEKFSGVKTVKAFCREDYEIERFGRENERNFWFSLKRSKIIALMEPVVDLLAGLGVLLVAWFSARLMIRGMLSLGEVLAFIAALYLIRDPLVGLSRIYGVWQQVVAGSARIFEIIEERSELKEDENAPSLPIIKGEIEFSNTSFAYEQNKFVLKDINLKISPGEVIALVGPLGSGKTTLLNLIFRFYDPQEGSVLVDGCDLRRVKIRSLREQIGIVPQEVVLFYGTIRENIAYGKLEATDEEIQQAARLANVSNFALKLTSGLNAHIGERGVRLSGGQRQCIAIARVLLKNPRIVLLDEATSSMDSESENIVQEAMSHLIKDRTTIIIAHRLSTVRHADRIVVLDQGGVVETGTHRQLMTSHGLYHRLYETQFKEREE